MDRSSWSGPRASGRRPCGASQPRRRLSHCSAQCRAHLPSQLGDLSRKPLLDRAELHSSKKKTTHGVHAKCGAAAHPPFPSGPLRGAAALAFRLKGHPSFPSGPLRGAAALARMLNAAPPHIHPFQVGPFAAPPRLHVCVIFEALLYRNEFRLKFSIPLFFKFATAVAVSQSFLHGLFANGGHAYQPR